MHEAAAVVQRRERQRPRRIGKPQQGAQVAGGARPENQRRAHDRDFEAGARGDARELALRGPLRARIRVPRGRRVVGTERTRAGLLAVHLHAAQEHEAAGARGGGGLGEGSVFPDVVAFVGLLVGVTWAMHARGEVEYGRAPQLGARQAPRASRGRRNARPRRAPEAAASARPTRPPEPVRTSAVERFHGPQKSKRASA